MTDNITWSEPKPHDGSSDCPVDARDVPCLLFKDDNTWTKQGVWGKHLWWRGIKAYRIPVPASDTVTADLVATLVDALELAESKIVGMMNAITRGSADAFLTNDPDIITIHAALTAAKDQQK